MLGRMATLPIDVVFDVVCPWCWIGERRLARSLAERPDLQARVRFWPYLLHPYVPREGMDKEALFRMKFGAPEAGRQVMDRIRRTGEAEGLTFRFDRIDRIPETTAAHCLVRWAGEESPERQAIMVDTLFRAHLSEGRDVGDPAVLAELAAEAGLDPDRTRTRLEADEDRDAVREEAARVRDRGVTGVPFFVINGRFPVMGAQEPRALLHVVDRALRKPAPQASSWLAP